MFLFSIITVTYNAESFIEKSIKSVLEQTNKNFEYIIIDGGSTDRTLPIISNYRRHINYFVSEKDKGIYDAMNKGIDAATGTYLFFLGADDFMYNNNVLLDIEKALNDNVYDLLIGNIIYTNNVVVKPSFSSKLLLHNSLHHQGALYNRQQFDNFRYNADLKIISDYELNLVLFLNRKNIKVLTLDLIISLCTDNGASRSMIHTFKTETNYIRSKYISSVKAKFLEMLFLLKVKVWNAVRHN